MLLHWAVWGAAVAYLPIMAQTNRTLKLLFKPLPIYLLIALAIQKGALNSTSGLFLVAALIGSAAGDLFLLYEAFFTHGLTAFLLAHLGYFGAFAGHPLRWQPLPFLLLGGLAALWLLRPGLLAQGGRRLLAAVSLYLAVILAMLWQTINYGQPLAIAGALSFVFSDFALAYHRFVGPLPYRDIIVMLSYYLAQYLLTLSLLGV